MMQALRKKTKYVLFIALAGFALLIFFQWGANVTGIRDERKTDIVRIDGIPISYTDYTRFVRSKESEYRGISREEIWNLLIEEMMWNNLIYKEKIKVTDEEILAVIKSNPPREIYESEYMKDENGEFDYNRYLELLRLPQSRSWLLEYEYNLRQQIPKEKLRSLLASFGWVSPYEDSVSIAAQTVQYEVSFLSLPLYRARTLLEISEDEAREYYDNNSEEFTTPELKILKFVFFEREPSHYDTLEAKELLVDFLDRIEDGEDFIEVAREVSDDTSVVYEFKGEVGVQSYLLKVYKGLKNGEISDVTQSSDGFEVIKRVRPGLIYRVKVNIEVSPTTIGEIYDRIMSFKETVKEYGFDSTAADFDLEVRKTYPLSSDNLTFPVRNTKGLADFLSKIKKGEIGGSFSSIGGYYLFSLDSLIPSTQPEFEEIIPKIKTRMETRKLRELIKDRLDQIYDQLVAGNTMKKIVSEDTILLLRKLENITLAQMQISLGHEFAGVAATLEPGQTSVPLIMDWAGYVLHCHSKTASPFDSTMLTALQMKRQVRLQDLTVSLFTPKDIEDNRDDFFE